MKTYLGNGMVNEYPDFIDNASVVFFIQETEGQYITDKYIYPDDSIKYELDNQLVDLYDLFRDFLFENTDQYYREVASLPIWVQRAGQDSDCAISSDMFSEWMQKANIPNLYKHLYLVDCQFLIGTVQNLLSAIEDAFINYYKTISEFKLDDRYKDLTDRNGTIMLMSPVATRASAYVETYFTKAYSVLDIMCKICYEIQYRRTDFESYEKLKSAEVLWGKRKKLQINETMNTIFEKCDFISQIEAIRNEIVHNGTWELNPKIFIRLKNYEEVERFMLFPDMEQGHLATVKNRKHFFFGDVKINDILPEIHLEFKRRMLNTLREIKCVYGTGWQVGY